jgi:hypothetical protein
MIKRKHEVVDCGPEHMDDIDDLLGRDWSRRAWTFQEIILATHPIVLCGNHIISWDNLMHGMFLSWEAYTLTPSEDPLTSGQMDLERGLRHGGASTSYQSIHEWHALFDVWMHMPRPTHWGMKQFRLELDEGTSFKAYQQRHMKIHTSWNDMRILASIPYLTCWLVFTFISGAPLQILLERVLITVVLMLEDRRGLHWFGPIPYHPQPLNLHVLATICATTAVLSLFPSGVFRYLWRVPRIFASGTISPHIQSQVSGLGLQDKEDTVENGVIYALRERVASNPKDRSYALHGILKNLQISLSKPDYAKSKGQVYQDLYSNLLHWRPSLLHLIIDAGGKPIPSAASWVPDWTSVLERTWLDSSYLYRRNRFSATPRSQAFVNLEGSELRVKGIVKEKIVYVSKPFNTVNVNSLNKNDLTTFVPLFKQIQELCCWISVLQKTIPVSTAYDSVPQAVFKVLIGQCTIIDGPKAQHFDKWYRLIGDHLHDFASESGPDILQSFHDLVSENEAVFTSIIECCNSLTRRSLFVDSGGYIGSSPLGLIVGDQVTLVAGVPVPLILRQDDADAKQYVLVGAAFVQGLMMGEAWDSVGLDEFSIL